MSDIVLPTTDDAAEIERIRQKVDTLSGAAVINNRNAIIVGRVREKQRSFPTPEEPILITLQSYTTENGATWKEINPPSGTNPASIKENGITNEDLGAAFEVNGNTGGFSTGSGTNGSHVWLYMRPDSNGAMVPVFAAGGNVKLGMITAVNSGGFDVKVVTDDGDGTYTVTDETDTVYEANGARGYYPHASSGQIVPIFGPSLFIMSIRLMNNTSHVGLAGGIGFAANVTTLEFALGSNGSSVATIRVAGSPSQYQVMQINGSGNLVFDWVRGHS